MTILDTPPAPSQALLHPGAIHAVTQPIVSLVGGHVVGYEALSRMTAQPADPPDVFLQRAQAHGLRAETELACLTAAIACGPPPAGARLFVNISASVLVDARVEELLDQLPPFVLEITEHERVDDYAALRARLALVARLGGLLAVDDVGAGYANMSHVLRLGPSFLKIDRSLVAGLHRDEQQRALVGALVAFGKQFGAMSVAEGVEAPEELTVLRDLGVDLVQGYLLGCPGVGWPSAADPRAVIRGGSPAVLPGSAPGHPDHRRELDGLAARIAGASHPREAADLVTRHLAEAHALLPTVYLEHAGSLRCLSRQGQWHVLDGMPPGYGITGSAFAAGTEIDVPDVTLDERYREAVPGIVAELALPLRLGEAVVGVLNVDARAPLDTDTRAAVRACVGLLEDQFARTGLRHGRDSALQLLGRWAPRIAAARTIQTMAEETVLAAVGISGLDTAVLWSITDGRWERLGAHGHAAASMAQLDGPTLAALGELVTGIASCYTAGTSMDPAFGPLEAVRLKGARAALVVALRSEQALVGMLVLSSTDGLPIQSEAVEAVEMLAVLAGTTMSGVARLASLKGLAYRDPLTGVANRARLASVIARHSAATGAPSWIAVVDVDRFKRVNDRYGHGTGDDLLRSLCAVLCSGAGQDAVFRLGGDEFALLVRGAADIVESRMQSILDRSSRLLVPYGAGLSIGVARVEPGDALQVGLARADAALYRRKRDGGSGVTVVGEQLLEPGCAG